MHEYSLVQALFDLVDATARANRAFAVRRVSVRIGQGAGVEVPLLRTAYETFRVGTMCAAAPLEIREVRVEWQCPAGHGSIAAGGPLACPICGCPARLTAGDEIVLDQVELEVR